jgi:SAM-dependent methyltransferase
MLNKNLDSYVGKELEIFASAVNWSNYISNQIKPYLFGCVFEVGAGIGSRTLKHCKSVENWFAIEPDIKMSENIKKTIFENSLSEKVVVVNGTLIDIPKDIFADSIIYIDVLEHIENDVEELRLAKAKLKTGGYLVVLSPAYQFLYTNFDREIGHYRRYDLDSLDKIKPSGFKPVKRVMLDSVGLIASLSNKFILKKTMPNRQQIFIWDKFMVSVSRFFDRFLFYKIGKSVLVVWQKND